MLSNDKFTINNIFLRYSGSMSLVEKWKTKFEEEKIPEVQSSLKILLGHVLNVKKVCVWFRFSFVMCTPMLYQLNFIVTGTTSKQQGFFVDEIRRKSIRTTLR